jgi:hypothetical protein
MYFLSFLWTSRLAQTERFQANVVAAMQKKKILGITSRYVVVAKKQS